MKKKGIPWSVKKDDDMLFKKLDNISDSLENINKELIKNNILLQLQLEKLQKT